jgi:hypothetical protein
VEEAVTSRFATDRIKALRLLLCSLKLMNKKMYGFASASIQKTNLIATVPTTICNLNKVSPGIFINVFLKSVFRPVRFEALAADPFLKFFKQIFVFILISCF